MIDLPIMRNHQSPPPSPPSRFHPQARRSSTTAGLCGLSFLQRRCEAMSSRSEAEDWAEELEAVAGRIAPRVRAGGAAPTRPGLSSGPAGPLGAEERLAPPRGGRGPTPQPPAGV